MRTNYEEDWNEGLYDADIIHDVAMAVLDDDEERVNIMLEIGNSAG